MSGQAGEGLILLIKKLGGLGLTIVGCLLTAEGFHLRSTGLITLGVIFLAAGVILLVLKIVRRNQSGLLVRSDDTGRGRSGPDS
jgi:hypothetical protein